LAKAPLWSVALVLLLWIPLAPLLGILVALWLVREGVRRLPGGTRALAHPVVPWAARAGLATIFVVSLVNLWTDGSALL
jgi:hypothetical protein